MFKVFCRGSKNGKWKEYSGEYQYRENAEICKKRAEERMLLDVHGNLIQYKIMEVDIYGKKI